MTKQPATPEAAQPEKGPGESSSKPAKNWEQAERLYRAGVLSPREIGERCGMSRQMVEKRAKKDGWQRDLTTRVKQAIAAKLVAREVAKEARTQPATEASIVDEASDEGAQVVRHHRKDINRARGIVNTLLAHLEGTIQHRDLIEDEIDAERAESLAAAANSDGYIHSVDSQRIETRRQAMRRAVSLPQNAAVMRDLAMSMKHLVGIEREAFGIGQPEEGAGNVSDLPVVAYDVSFGP